MLAVWWAATRGVGARRAAAWALLVVAPIASSFVTIQLRTSADHDAYGRALANGVLVGLVLPVSYVGIFLEDRSCWLQVGAARRLAPLRAAWFAALTMATVLIGLALAWILGDRVPARLLFADTLFLWALCALSAVLVGGRNSWILPALTALAFSTPGLIPLAHNVLSLATHSGLVLCSAVGLIVVAGVLFTRLDEWRLSGGLRRNLTMGDVLE